VLAGSQAVECHGLASTAMKASVTFYAPVVAPIISCFFMLRLIWL
jgi:hypothetical protein